NFYPVTVYDACGRTVQTAHDKSATLTIAPGVYFMKTNVENTACVKIVVVE
ncbi:T9SS type A sorting domain-containing protein, partial [candidate division WOR-3 bacterium]|nr:T9SS type A sorting domain-containing protein [candidate division WOR-3 bacterium]